MSRHHSRSVTAQSRSSQLQQVCSLSTHQCTTPEECLPDFEDIRAYKLGKKRWSYNQCELTVYKEGAVSAHKNAQKLNVLQTTLNTSSSDEDLGNKVSYQVQLNNGSTIRVDVFLVIAKPVGAERGQCQVQTDAGAPYQWTSVTRSSCKKGCTGPVLRSIQRFGRLGRRSNGPGLKAGGTGAAAGGPALHAVPQRKVRQSNFSKDSKESRYMYLSMDEAGTHVGGHSFRLIVGAFDEAGESLLGTGCSPPIRVLSNNDVPTGAAFIRIALSIRADWEGWAFHAANSPDSVLEMPSPLNSPMGLTLSRPTQARQADSPTLSPPSESPDFLPPHPPLDLESHEFIEHQSMLHEAAASSPFRFRQQIEQSAFSPDTAGGMPLMHEEEEFSSDEALMHGQTSPETSPQMSCHLSSQMSDHMPDPMADHAVDHMTDHMPVHMASQTWGCAYGESCGQMQGHNGPESADDELLGIIKHAQSSMAAAMEAAAAAAAAINARGASNREQLLSPTFSPGGLNRSWRHCVAGQDCSEPQQPNRDARRSLMLDGYDDAVVSRQSQNALNDSGHAMGLPFKQTRMADAAETSPSITAVTQPQSLQQLMTASNFLSHGASPHTLQGLAEHGQSTAEAIQQRAARWAEQRAQPQAERHGLPSEKGCLDGIMGAADHDRVHKIRLELERRQQHAVMHMAHCSAHTSGYSLSQNTSSPGMVRSSSANLESSCNPRDPRQDPRGMKRVYTANCLSTSPAKRLLPFPQPSADLCTGLHIPSLSCGPAWSSSRQPRAHQSHPTPGPTPDWPQQPYARFNINQGPPRSAGLLPRYTFPQVARQNDSSISPSWHAAQLGA